MKGRQENISFWEALYTGSASYEGRCKFEMNNVVLNVFVSIESGSIRVDGLPRNNNPIGSRQVFDHFDELAAQRKGDGQKFKISPIGRFNFWRSKVADLRVAYLIAFALLGYRYGFDLRLDVVRGQILEPNSKILEGFWLFLGRDKLEENQIILAERPVECLLVQLGRHAIVLPWLDGPENPYEVFKNLSRGSSVKFTGRKLAWPKAL
jgi:hypothetical protein